MKETLEFVDKLQVNLDKSNAVKTIVEARAKTAEDQVIDLQWRVPELQSQVEKNRTTTKRVVELEAELQQTVARGKKMFFQGQDSIKKEFTRQFLGEDFSWIDNNFRMRRIKMRRGRSKLRITLLTESQQIM